MPATHLSFNERLNALSSTEFLDSLTQIRRGIEREALRIQPNGVLAATSHPAGLGSALTHASITTDFSESLLEFITPPETDADVTIEQLQDVHKFALNNMQDELLWPLSMPCFIENQDQIPLAWYGESNVGKMKRIYRLGLKNRYGSMMQAIAGVHFNFSFDDSFWKEWAKLHGQEFGKEQIAADYFALIRNYRRLCWIIPYLYGASPAICSSFLGDKNPNLPLQKIGKGTLYLPHATSLRMSDLGYTNAEQSALQICYNQLDNYVRLLRTAMRTKSERFTHFAAGEGGHYQQLSHNILQIENELYSPIRPKQPTRSMEKPTDALVRRGVSYIEVRALDVNPFTPIGITREQIDFLDVFLLSCLLMPSPQMDAAQLQESGQNMNRIVLQGREPGLTLSRSGENIAMAGWAENLFTYFAQTATVLDKAGKTTRYSSAVQRELKKIQDPESTFSGKMMALLLDSNSDNGALGLKLASQYAGEINNYQYQHQQRTDFEALASASHETQRAIEEADDKDFDTFIKDYFNEPPAKKNA